MKNYFMLAVAGIVIVGNHQLAPGQDRWSRAESAPAAVLGRPVAAAALGQPRVLGVGDSTSDVHTAGYLNGRPAAAIRGRGEAVPSLSPIPLSGPLLTDAPQPAPTPGPMPPADGAAGAVPEPVYGPPIRPAGPLLAGAFDPSGPYAGQGPWWTRTWVAAEFLAWFVKNATSPALVFTTPVPPVIGAEVPLFTGASLYPQSRLGARISTGLWFDPCRMHGVESSFFFLGTRTFNRTFTAAPGQILVRRIIDAQNGNVPVLGETATTMTVSGLSQLLGGDLNYRRVLTNECGTRLDFLLGFKYLNLHETLRFTESGTGVIPGFGIATGTGIDEFATTNNFYGGQVGLRGERHFGRFYAEGFGKIAFGATAHRVAVSGGQTFVAPAPPPSGLPGNLLALNSNIGIRNATSFSMVPEVGLNLGYHLTPRLRLFVGYTFMYWSNVLRPGDQIDIKIQPNRIPYVNLPPIPPPAAQEVHPVVPFTRTDFWAQGVNVGLQFKW